MQQEPSTAKRWIAVIETVSLVGLSVLLGWLGWIQYKHADDRFVARPSPQFSIEFGGIDPRSDRFPPPLSDSMGPLNIKSVDYVESRNSTGDGILIRVSAHFDRVAVGQVPVQLHLLFETTDLSTWMCDESTFSHEHDEQMSCETETLDKYPMGIGGLTTITEGQHLVSVKLKKHAVFTGRSHPDSGVGFSFGVGGDDGIGVSESRTRTEVRFPSIVLSGEAVRTGPPPQTYSGDRTIAVNATYQVPGEAHLTWSRTVPTTSAGEPPRWEYEVGGLEGRGPPEGASGVREDLLAENTRQTFVAGALIGAAAGAAVPAMQIVVRLLTESAFSAVTKRRRLRS
ncbi:hypothetical protein JNN96_16795 [Mycobacterium sp. DSM 3803]|nr:hypothetical protein [Mycobacterium sp. DSM 3803]